MRSGQPVAITSPFELSLSNVASVLELSAIAKLCAQDVPWGSHPVILMPASSQCGVGIEVPTTAESLPLCNDEIPFIQGLLEINRRRCVTTITNKVFMHYLHLHQVEVRRTHTIIRGYSQINLWTWRRNKIDIKLDVSKILILLLKSNDPVVIEIAK